MAGAILKLATNPQEAHAMGKRGRDYVTTHYSRHEQARSLENILLEVLSK
jgi:glycosyltransferase involved in cell wall biosynthesis